MRVPRLFIALGLLLVLGALERAVAGGDGITLAIEGTDRWQLRADEFHYDGRSGTYAARGKVELRSTQVAIKAERLRFDPSTGVAIAEGGVKLEQGRDWLRGERLTVDLRSQRGSVQKGSGFLADNHFYFGGERIEKTGPRSYYLEGGTFTTCDGDKPSWHFQASKLRLTVDGYGQARDVRFYVGPLPLLYTPYLVFPAKRTRQSGLLPPRLASSELRGSEIDLPLYWAIGPSSDLTAYAHYMSKRGWMPGLELRYALALGNRGVLRFDYLDDREDSQVLRQQGFRQVAPGFSGDYSRRWWLRSKHDFSLPAGVDARVDIDLVSDPDFLREFDTGFSGLEESNRQFESLLDRVILNDDSVTTRESSALFSRTWANHGLSVDFRYFQNLNRLEDERTLQKLPAVNYHLARSSAAGWPLTYEGYVDYVNYFRPEGTRGHRVHLEPRLALPLNWGPYLEVEPAASLLETVYYTEQFAEDSNSEVKEKRLQSRELYKLEVRTSTALSRIFALDLARWRRLRHTVRPEMLYEYLPSLNQAKFPQYDDLDRVQRTNRLTYGVTNFVAARNEAPPGTAAKVVEIARVKISQSYDFNEAKRSMAAGAAPRHPFSPLRADVDFVPATPLSLAYHGEWSTYDGDFKRHELLVHLARQGRGDLTFDYRQLRDEAGEKTTDEINGKLEVAVVDGLVFGLRSNYSLIGNDNLETEYRLQLDRQCWGLTFSFVDQPNDRRFLVGFRLYGVGEVQPEIFGQN